MREKIAILGWGSLLWDTNHDFTSQHQPWQYDGPGLPIEFSRISSSRKNALTLVLDETNGTSCTVAYCTSTRNSLHEAIDDLVKREGTIRDHIGYWSNTGKEKSGTKTALRNISNWANSKNFQNVIWTDLPGNFKTQTKKDFTIDNAINYLEALPEEGKKAAMEYIRNAPDFVITPLRKKLISTS